jgi:holo-[acyl-carrier protein] synthase
VGNKRSKNLIVGHGIDIMSTRRIRRTVELFGGRFIKRIYTPEERGIIGRHPAMSSQMYATYWAVKEAAMKALGTGNRMGVRFRDIEVRHESTGKPYLRLYGKAREFLEKLGATNVLVSMSHLEDVVVASVILENTKRN